MSTVSMQCHLYVDSVDAVSSVCRQCRCSAICMSTVSMQWHPHVDSTESARASTVRVALGSGVGCGVWGVGCRGPGLCLSCTSPSCVRSLSMSPLCVCMCYWFVPVCAHVCVPLVCMPLVLRVHTPAEEPPLLISLCYAGSTHAASNRPCASTQESASQAAVPSSTLSV